MKLSLLRQLSFISFLITLGKTQRSIVLTQWLGMGTRNVKYETIANNIFDSNGKFIIISALNYSKLIKMNLQL